MLNQHRLDLPPKNQPFRCEIPPTWPMFSGFSLSVPESVWGSVFVSVIEDVKVRPWESSLWQQTPCWAHQIRALHSNYTMCMCKRTMCVLQCMYRCLCLCVCVQFTHVDTTPVWIIFNLHSCWDLCTRIQEENQFESSEATVIFNLHNTQWAGVCLCMCVCSEAWRIGPLAEICHSAGESMHKTHTHWTKTG